GRGGEEGVPPHAPRLVAGHGVGDLVRGEAVGLAAHPGRLVGDVVRHLRLVHVHAAAVTVPERLVLLVVLVEQAVDGHTVAVDDQAVLRRVGLPRGTGTVVRTPNPDLIGHDMIAMDQDAHIVPGRLRPTGAH